MPHLEALEDWVIRYFSYLDRIGAFVIRSVEDSPNDPNPGGGGALASSYRRGAGRSHRQDRHDTAASAAGLVVMAMLDRCWLMAQHDEMTLMSRDTVLGALTELMFRMLS